MPIPKKIINFLEKAKVKYELIEHRTVYTAYDKAATLKVPQKIIGKTLIVKLDKNPALILIPANKNLNIRSFKKVKKVFFVKEAWIKKNLKGVKIGAVPPFGNLWGMPTFADKNFLKQGKIIVSSGKHDCSIKITSSVFKKSVSDLTIGIFSKSRK